MKFSDFVKTYPYYSRFRFSNYNGNVVFNFNGNEFDPFDSQGNLKERLYHFLGNKWPPENINDFLVSDNSDYKEAVKENELYRFIGHANYTKPN